jgi:hypothetical protein
MLQEEVVVGAETVGDEEATEEVAVRAEVETEVAAMAEEVPAMVVVKVGAEKVGDEEEVLLKSHSYLAPDTAAGAARRRRACRARCARTQQARAIAPPGACGPSAEREAARRSVAAAPRRDCSQRPRQPLRYGARRAAAPGPRCTPLLPTLRIQRKG